MKCLICKKNEAIKHEYYGYLPCNECRARQDKQRGPDRQVEFTTDSIKTQRKEFADDIVQPFRKGELSKEYVDRYGTKGLQVTQKEAQKSKKVWSDTNYYKD